MKSAAALAAVLAAALLMGGCATQPGLYAWGRYEELIYAAYSNPGSMPPERQIGRAHV